MYPFQRQEERYKPKPAEPVFVDLVGEGFYDRCKVRDISLNGISIFVRHDFQGINLDLDVDIHITLPTKLIVKAVGKIRHQGLGTDHYYGIHLIQIDTQLKPALEDYVNSLK